MTSGAFDQVPIDQITINRDARQRRELTGIEELARSLSRNGLIHPIVVRAEDSVLVAGERRLTAAKSLGWTHITVQFAENLSEEELKIIELEENVRRVDISWQDQCRAIEEYHNTRAAMEEGWNGTKTAAALDFTQSHISTCLQVAKALVKDERVAAAPKFSVARGIVQRNNERAKASVLAEIDNKPKPKIPLIHADFTEWMKSYEGPKFNFLHCDFPYGVGANKQAQGGNIASFGGYDDSADVFWSLVSSLEWATNNIVAESAHLQFWFSMDYYNETKERLTAMGWKVNPFPLIWHKSDNSGILPDFRRGPRRTYETAFLCSRGDRFIVSPVANSFAHAVTKDIHMSEKPVPMLKHFFRMFVDEYTVMLDPTAGSANSLKAATVLGANSVLGIEQNEEFYNRAKENFSAID